MIRICFVCLGNICRSPTAEGVMHSMLQKSGWSEVIELDSAGTGAWHTGERADARSRATAAKRGYELASTARQFLRRDFERFDYVLAMDRSNRDVLLRMARNADERDKVHLFRSFDSEAVVGAEVPDPYYGGDRGFEEVLDICERACRGLLQHLSRNHSLKSSSSAM